jgi:hypothetical protein
MPLFGTSAGNVLFIHVPKTGGSSIEQHLSSAVGVARSEALVDRSVQSSPQHFHGEVLTRVLQDVPLCYSFMVVRHPVERIRSEYKFQTRRHVKSYRLLSFSLWLRYHLGRARHNRSHRDNHFRPAREFEAWSPEVFRLEEGLSACFERLQAMAGIVPPTEEIHVKKSRPMKVDIGKADTELIYEFYREDFERYGYRR